MKLKQFIFALVAMLLCFASPAFAQNVAKVGNTEYATIEEALAAAEEGQTVTLLADATPVLKSQSSITKAAIIDLGDKTMTLKEDDLYFGTTTFKNGTIVVDPSVKPSTAVFWMFKNQTLTFDNVKIVATGVTGTYLIGLEGENSDLNLLNGSEILVENTTTLDLDIICVNGTNTCDIKVENSKVNVSNLDGRVFFRGNYIVKDSEIALAGITKAGFRIEAGQTLSIEGNSKVTIEGEPRDGGIHLTDLTATYIKAETATVNATVNEPKVAKVGENTYRTLALAVAAVEDGGTITLIANETFTKNNRYNNGGWWDGLGYSGDKSFTIDLAGFTISQDGSLNDYLLWFKNAGSKKNTITIKNGTLDAGTTAFCALCTASSHENELTINTENLTLINNKSDGSTVKVRAGSVLNVKEGTKITGKDSYLGIENWKATVNIYDGAEIYMNGTSSYNGCLVGVGGNGTVNVYGGKGKGVSGGFIAMTSGGTINVEGGEWIANTDGTYANSNKSVLIAQSDKQYNAGAGNSVVNVTGGTFKGGYNCYGNKAGDAQINIKGGNFNANPTSYVAEGYFVVENNGVWTVERGLAGAGTEAEPYLINNVNELVAFRNSVNAGETKYNAPGVWVVLCEDIDLAGTAWERGIGDGITATFDGNFDGKGKTIKNFNVQASADSDKYLCAALFGYTYGGVTIKNLTIENANVEFTSAVAGEKYHNVGVLVAFANNSKGGKLNIDNVTVKGDIKIDAPQTFGVGAIVGYSYYGMGSITNTKVCPNSGSIIKGERFVGGIIGYSDNNAIIDKCSVENLAISGSNGVAGVAGLALNGNKITNCSVTNTTVNAESNVAYIVGELGSGNGGDVLIENCNAPQPWVGGSYATSEPFVASIGNKYYTSIAKALEVVKNGETITLVKDITENVTLTEKAGLYYTIDGADKAMKGNITVNSLSDTNDNRRITIKNINFVDDSDANVDFISSVNTNHYPRLTVEGCTFTGSGNNGDVALRLKSSHSVVIKDCTGTGLHSFLQNTSGWNLTIENVKVTDSKSGLALGTVQGVTVKGCEADVAGYGIRLDAQYNNNAVIESNTVKAFIPVVVRKAEVNSNVTVQGANTFNASNTDGLWMAVGTSEYEKNGELPTAATGKVVVTLNDTGLDNEGIYGNYVVLAGKGTEAEPFLIKDIKELVAFRNSVNGGETRYSAPGVWVALAADIDMTGENWVGIGSATADHGFMGNFDGKNFKIMNLTITNPALDSDGYAYAGLFGVTEGTDKDNQNTIKNLIIENVTIETNGHIVAAAIAYPYYTIIDNVKVCGNIAITGGDYTAGVLAYTRRCVNASNLSIIGENNSFVKGAQVVGGVISDIQMNGGLTADYKNFSAEGVTIIGTKNVGGISGIIATQTLNGATVKNVTLNGQTGVGIVSGALGGTSTISNVTYENVTGATALIGATYDGAKAVQAKIGNTYYATLEAAQEAAQEGATVELLAPVVIASGETLTLDKNVTVVYTSNVAGEDMFTNRGTLNISAGTTTYANTDATASNVTVSTISSEPGSVLNITGGTVENKTVKADGSSIYSFAIDMLTNGNLGDVTATINGGTVSSDYMAIRQFNNGTACKNTLEITGGHIYGAKRAVQVHIDNNAAYTTISGGKVEAGVDGYAICNFAATGNLEVTGGEFIGAVYSAREKFISGGTYNNPVEAAYCAEGFMPNKNADGTYGVVEVANVYASIDGVTYGSLKAAVAAAKAGQTIVLLQDVKENVTISKHLTIDGAGKTITGMITTDGKSLKVTIKNVNFNGNNQTENYALRADDELNLVVQDCSAKDYKYGFLYANKSNDKIVVKNVTVENCASYGAYLVSFNSASFENFKVSGARSGIIVDNSSARKVNLKNVTFEGVETPLATNDKGTSIVTFAFDGINEMGKTAFYSNFAKVVAAAQVDTKVCGSLQDAVVVAKDGDTVKVLDNLNMTTANMTTQVDGYAVLVNVADKAVTIDLNGKKVTVNAAHADLNGKAKGNMLMSVFHADPNGTLTLTDNSAEGTGTVELYANDATVYGLIVSENSGDKTKSGKIVINGGNYIADKLSDSMIFADTNEVITVNGGNFTLGNVGTGANGKPWIFNTLGNNQIHILVNGGTFNADVNHQYWAFEVSVPETKALQSNGDGTWTVVPSVAYVTEKYNKYTRKAGYATLEDAIASKYGNEVTLLTDIDRTQPVAIPSNKVVTLYLNGKTIAGTDEGTASFGLININPGAELTINGEGAITLKATNNRGWNAYSSVISNQRAKLTVNGGTIEHLGGTDMAYAIDNLTNTGAENAETEINGGTVKSTYRAIRQFLNSTSAQNILTVNGGTIEGANKSIWMQEANAKANPGTLTVTEDAELSGNVYISAAAGATELPIEIAVASAALKNSSEVVLSNAPEYYYLLETNGVWGIEYAYIDRLDIVDGAEDEFVNQNEKTVGTLTYTRTFGSKYQGVWMALYVPFEIPVSELTDMGYEVAYFNDFRETLNADGEIIEGKSVIEMVKIKRGTLKANYPYAIKAPKMNPEESVTLELVLDNVTLYSTTGERETVECSSATKRFTFSGTYKKGTKSDIVGSNDIPFYALYETGMSAMGETAKLGAFRVYMTITMKNGEPYIADNSGQAAHARAIPLRVIGEEDENGATIIYDVVEDNLNNNGNDFIYDLQGRRVSEPKKGGIYIKNGKKILY